MKRALGVLFRAAVALAFVACVEVFCWRQRQRRSLGRPAVRPQARLRVRHGADRERVTIAVEGTLDEFGARLLSHAVAQVPHSTPTILDLSEAGPIRGSALVACARLFAAGRQVRLRGLGNDQVGLLALCPPLRKREGAAQRPSLAPGPIRVVAAGRIQPHHSLAAEGARSRVANHRDRRVRPCPPSQLIWS